MVRVQDKIVSENGGDCMSDFFGPHGLFRSKLPGFEHRPQQEELSRAIKDLLDGRAGRILAAEAPPGVGKTFALLAPAMTWAQKTGSTVVMLTSSITLQEQLIQKDLPTLVNVLGLPLPFGLLKGRNNYACLRKATELGDEGLLSFNDKGEASSVILEWLVTTDEGDLSELPLPPGHPALERIAASFRGCLGSRCPHRDQCFVQKGLRSAAKWRVVVANYHLYFSYALGRAGGFPIPAQVILCDEAHRMADAASSVSAMSVRLDDWTRHLRRIPLPGLDAAGNSAVGYDQQKEADGVRTVLRAIRELFEGLMVSGVPNGLCLEFPERLLRTGREVLAAVAPLVATGRRFEEYLDELGPLGEEVARKGAEYLSWVGGLDEMAQALRWCLDVEDYPRWTYWKEDEALYSAPSRCDDFLPRAFQGDEPPLVAAVSATMAVDRRFEFWSRETGLCADAELLLDSPFPLERQMTILVVDLKLPVTDSGYDERVCRVVRRLCRGNQGSSLVLLSSIRLLRRVGEFLRKNDDGYTVLVQGDRPRAELLRRFREDPSSVLVGTVSFREGVDIPGDSLTQVIVDRIPFPHPDDPLQRARRDLDGGSSFVQSVLPSAKMHLRQAVGRLIRSETDQGRVAILDGRVLSRRDWKVLESLPNVPIRRIRVVDRSEPEKRPS
ncbi:MAG: ATP-dependent helicase [Dethiosulfovibrio peptidovorans]|nr:MAG: ATP-dependent helicase [Dethiosulfovibrio peptidovorans]